MGQQRRSLARSFARVGAFFAVLFGLYLAWSWWEQRQLYAFCESLRPGTPVSTLSDLAEKRGFSRSWIERGLNGKTEGAPAIHVPATTSLGTLVCEIRHDGTAVTAAKVDAR